MDIPTGLAVAALAAPLVGVYLGSLLTRRSEHRRWLRDSRREAYARFLSASDLVRRLVSAVERDEAAIEDANTELGEAFSGVALVGSNDLHHVAYDLLGILITFNVARSGYEGHVNHDAAARGSDIAIEQRWKFIEEARRDLQVKPAALPTQVKGKAFADYEKAVFGD